MVDNLKEAPKVSVIMAAYNSARYISESIESVLGQSMREFELIIIDDGSTDNTSDIVKEYKDNRILYLKQSNAGPAAARNNGIRHSKSELIAILDADDLAMPERLESQCSFLLENPNYAIVGSNVEVIDQNSEFVYNIRLPKVHEEIMSTIPHMPFVHPSIMFKKQDFLSSGQYPEYMLRSQDRVLLNRLVKLGKCRNMESSLTKYRIVPGSNSVRNSKKMERFEKIILKAIENDKISDDDIDFMKEAIKGRSEKDKLFDYHFFLAKKYLWNNFQPKLARANIYKAIFSRNWSLMPLLLLLLSFLPKQVVAYLHSKLKSS